MVYTVTRLLIIAPAIIALSFPLTTLASGIYPASNIGYDISFNTVSYPSTNFNFAIIGVTRGKAFRYNTRLISEFSWAHIGSATAPTLYMNLNAPYGSTVAGHISAPKSCPARPVGSSATNTEPTVCEGYNYGYNAAKDAFAFAKNSGASSRLWWLDIEEANSWSTTTTVNDATIQGAIDYLNSQGVRVGIYSMGYMWKNIAGSDFIPTQVLDGQEMKTPTWVPIGITNQVGAINACVTKKNFIPNNPIWLVQYVLDSTSVDQNLSCHE